MSGEYGTRGMQITRHWRMNNIRYRMEGVRYSNGEVSLQDRPKNHKSSNGRAMQGDIVRTKEVYTAPKSAAAD